MVTALSIVLDIAHLRWLLVCHCYLHIAWYIFNSTSDMSLQIILNNRMTVSCTTEFPLIYKHTTVSLSNTPNKHNIASIQTTDFEFVVDAQCNVKTLIVLTNNNDWSLFILIICLKCKKFVTWFPKGVNSFSFFVDVAYKCGFFQTPPRSVARILKWT